MHIIYIRYTLLRNPYIHQTHILEVLTPATQTTLQNKSILGLSHPLRHRSRNHLQKLIPGNRQRLIHLLRIRLILLRLHPRHITLIRTPFHFTIQDHIIPERMEMNQHLPQRLLLQLLLRPPTIIHIIPRIQMRILRNTSIQILINTELLKLHNQLQSHLRRQHPRHLLNRQESLQLTGQRIRLPMHLLTEPAHRLLFIQITAEPLHHSHTTRRRILLQLHKLRNRLLKQSLIHHNPTLQQIQKHLTQHSLIPLNLPLQPSITPHTRLHRTILSKRHHLSSIHHHSSIKGKITKTIIPHLKPQRSLTASHIRLLEQNHLKHNTILQLKFNNKRPFPLLTPITSHSIQQHKPNMQRKPPLTPDKQPQVPPPLNTHHRPTAITSRT